MARIHLSCALLENDIHLQSAFEFLQEPLPIVQKVETCGEQLFGVYSNVRSHVRLARIPGVAFAFTPERSI